MARAHPDPTPEFPAFTPVRRSFHPLELIPIFSRWSPGPLRDFVYSFIFNTLIALVFTALATLFSDRIELDRQFFVTFVFAQCIGYTIYFIFFVLDAVIPVESRRRPPVRWLYFTVIPVIGCFIGYWIATLLLGFRDTRAEMFTPRGVISILTVALIIAGILIAIFVPRERAARAQVMAAAGEARANAAERAAALARLQLLEAQVEPHFLYNTLAHVVSLVDREPALAKRMLHRLIDLLRATASSAQRSSTLGTQIELLRAYLDLIALRMGPRLAWSIDAPPDLAALGIPPMLLQPVVENAIKHGLEPSIEGGRVEVSARRDGATLVLTVVDTGLGVSPTRSADSSGLGLANLRARLSTLFGDAASLRIADNAPAGTRVTITLPI
ncbi:MAG TPA: histidine kinase [Casimicrobiaceae bacterium]|nr:histidine kinase [Casimicrobiaceae bacterium]